MAHLLPLHVYFLIPTIEIPSVGESFFFIFNKTVTSGLLETLIADPLTQKMHIKWVSVPPDKSQYKSTFNKHCLFHSNNVKTTVLPVLRLEW